MNFGQAVATCLGKYATFGGRASRSEFWWFYLFASLVSFLSGFLIGLYLGVSEVTEADATLGGAAMVQNLVNLVLTLPMLAVGARRLHDADRSGWWQLLVLTGIGVLVLIFWWVQPTKPEPNRFGDQPAPSGAP
jgi:uncharacterized membrane protein YhaH (DUF805 family)